MELAAIAIQIPRVIGVLSTITKDFKLSVDKDFYEGQFRLILQKDGLPITNLDFLLFEEVTCVKRKCCSLTSFFPSGIFTVFTFLLLGKAIRHEYAVLYTTNYTICIEVGNDKGTTKVQPVIWIKLYSCDNNNHDILEKIFEKETKKYYSRSLCTLKNDELYKLKFPQILLLIQMFICLARQNDGYSVWDSNCKNLARSILYFSKSKYDVDYVLYSLLGLFTDKPLCIPHVDIILIEKTLINVYKVSSKDKKRCINMLNEAINKIRDTDVTQSQI